MAETKSRIIVEEEIESYSIKKGKGKSNEYLYIKINGHNIVIRDPAFVAATGNKQFCKFGGESETPKGGKYYITFKTSKKFSKLKVKESGKNNISVEISHPTLHGEAIEKYNEITSEK